MYEVVRYAPELRPAIAALQRHLWSGDVARNAAYLAWKYEHNPYLPDPLIYLALHRGKVVGMRGAFGSCWEAGGDRTVVPCVDDFVIAPAHRRRGLVGQIMAVALADLGARGHRVAFSLSASRVTLVGSLAGGWRSVGSVQEVCRRGPVGARLRRQAGRVWGRLARHGWPVSAAHAWLDPFRRLDRAVPRAAAGGVRCVPTPEPEAMADLVARQPYDGAVRHVRDARYFGWRFANPLHEYRFLLAGTGRLEGYLILQAYRLFPGRGANIVDWEASDPDVREALLRAAIDWGGFGELTTWTMSFSAEIPTLLAAAGFVPARRDRLVRQGPMLLVRAVGGPTNRREPTLGGRPLLDAAAWDLRMLYSMAG